MKVLRIEGFTRELGKPVNWDNEKDGHCASLPIRDLQFEDGSQYMVSAWEPTPEELNKIIQGESIKLWIQGINHPVVTITVGDI